MIYYQKLKNFKKIINIDKEYFILFEFINNKKRSDLKQFGILLNKKNNFQAAAQFKRIKRMFVIFVIRVQFPQRSLIKKVEDKNRRIIKLILIQETKV